MERIRKDIKSGGAHLTAPPFKDEGPVAMKRTVGKGKSGNSFSLTNRGKYGQNEGVDVVRMGRTVGKGPSGSNFKLSGDGPARSGRSPSGTYSHDASSYGVGGVSGSGGTGYGVGGK